MERLEAQQVTITKFRINGKCERFNCSIDITVINLDDGKTSDLDFVFDALDKQVVEIE